MSSTNHHGSHHSAAGLPVALIELTFCYCGIELAELEQTLAALPGVASVHVDRTRSLGMSRTNRTAPTKTFSLMPCGRARLHLH